VKGTKQFYEIMEGFEKFVKSSSYVSRVRLDRAESAPIGIFYDDGNANSMFHVYMAAYQHGRQDQ